MYMRSVISHGFVQHGTSVHSDLLLLVHASIQEKAPLPYQGRKVLVQVIRSVLWREWAVGNCKLGSG